MGSLILLISPALILRDSRPNLLTGKVLKPKPLLGTTWVPLRGGMNHGSLLSRVIEHTDVVQHFRKKKKKSWSIWGCSWRGIKEGKWRYVQSFLKRENWNWKKVIYRSEVECSQRWKVSRDDEDKSLKLHGIQEVGNLNSKLEIIIFDLFSNLVSI